MSKVLLIITIALSSLFKAQQSKPCKATWYEGRKSKSGYLTTAAESKYKFGQILKVTNVKNNKSVIVEVNDRGYFEQVKVCLDLSKKAFKQIGLLRDGVAMVRIEILK